MRLATTRGARVMAHSCLVAGIAAAVLSIGSLSFASDAVARSGGMSFGRGGGGGHVGFGRGIGPGFAPGRTVPRHIGRHHGGREHHGRHGFDRRHGKGGDRFPQDGGVVPYGAVYTDGSLGYSSQYGYGYPSQYGSG